MRNKYTRQSIRLFMIREMFFSILSVLLSIFLIFGIIWVLYLIYAYWYFNFSASFAQIKESIKELTSDANELNDHIEDLKNAYIYTERLDNGAAEYHDNSRYNFQRPELKQLRENPNTHYCSLQVCHNAGQKPFDYICKYFNLGKNEETLEKFEKMLNDFAAAEQGKELLRTERDEIVASISHNIPFLIRRLSSKRLIRELGFHDIDFGQEYFLQYKFIYISAGGNSSRESRIILDIANLNRFLNYLSEKIKFRKSIAGQRALMTTQLREKIKSRDAYECKICGVSINDEPNLLLEIDHIIPLSKGGLTSEDNLQTLCWRCNRQKGAKIIG